MSGIVPSTKKMRARPRFLVSWHIPADRGMHSIERAEWNVASGEGRACARAAPFLEMECFPKLLANIRQWPGLAFYTARRGLPVRLAISFTWVRWCQVLDV